MQWQQQQAAISNLQLLLPSPLPYSSSVSASAIVDGKRSDHQQLQQLQSATATATSVNRQLLQSAVIDAMNINSNGNSTIDSGRQQPVEAILSAGIFL